MRRARPLVVPDWRVPYLRDRPSGGRRRLHTRTPRAARRRQPAGLLLPASRRPGRRPLRSTGFRWSVAGDLAAVDVQDLSGDERRRLQEENPVDHIADLTDASERVEPSERVVRLRGMLRRLDDAQRDRVDPNAAGRVLDG